MSIFDETFSKRQSSATSRINTARESQQIQTSPNDKIFYQGYLTMKLRCFEECYKKLNGIIEFNPSLKMDELLKNETPTNSAQLQKVSSQLKLSPRLEKTLTPRSRKIRIDHDEEKERYCVIKNQHLIIYNSIQDSLTDNWHVKILLNSFSVESILEVNNPAAFQMKMIGKNNPISAQSCQDKWKWIAVFRDAFYCTGKKALEELKIIEPKENFNHVYPPPPIPFLERGKCADFLDLLLNIPSNSCCMDCSNPNILNADLTYGVFLCRDCSDIHKKNLRSNIIPIKTLYLKNDTKEFDLFIRKGNCVMEDILIRSLNDDVICPKKEDLLNSTTLKQEFIPIKYRNAPK